ncbi:MBL fold metallo-hydrolase [Rossellomorea aquimaris]|uniref:MBL fold metallo-hydrolase n=1 Tax=Rossellomorea aquimaris TaxID=189382 RepID=UPI001CD75AA3|nr:MBL fold metallo-hydrolase [Rossellomorea aquimaris]MCA1055339.1 MBL fold metallo-hydrolase [Rossellomorea aquimaris]
MSMQPMPVKDVAKKIMKKERIFILDVRGEEDYKNWKIEGETVETLNISLKEIKESPQEAKAKLPEDEPIYVVCAKGISSQDGVEILREAGVEDITYVVNGMNGWSEHLEPVKIGKLPGEGGAIYQFVRLGKGCLSYLIESDGEAAIVDANRMTGFYTDFIDEQGIGLKAVMDTHLHADHISGGRDLAKQYDAAYYFPEKDDEGVEFQYTPLRDGDEITVGAVTIKPFYSPGHTIGSTSLIVNDEFLLSGDILFVESIGRPDLAGKAEDWVGDLRDTLYERYKSLSPVLTVLPSHFGEMTELNADGSVYERLDRLYEKNQKLKVDDREKFRHLVTDHLPEEPNSHEEIRETNMGKKQPDESTQQKMETGPNNCSV